MAKFLDGKELVFLFVEAFFDFFEVQACLGVGFACDALYTVGSCMSLKAGLGVGFACDALYIFGIDANSGCFHGGYNLKVYKNLYITFKYCGFYDFFITSKSIKKYKKSSKIVGS